MEDFANYYGQTSLHPFALTAMLILSVGVLALRRRLVLVPLLLAATTMPMAQRIVVGPADFTLLRVLLLAYIIRIVMRSEWTGVRWNKIDTAVVFWVVSGVTIMTINRGTVDAFVNRAGWAYDILFTYFAVRCLLRDWSDLDGLAKSAVVMSVPVAILFFVEWTTQHNLFSIFGGVPEITRVTEGRLRCQGPFAHPILAGAFWAALLPVIWSLRHEDGGKRLIRIGTVAVLVIVFTSSSSTSVVSVAAAFLGAVLFRFRDDRARIWKGFFLMLAVLHLFVMEQPVWHLMGRVDILGGSTGWHRFKIFDVFVNHFPDWWLTGNDNPRSWHWFMRDITNQYILEGLRGGLLTLCAFILVLARAFSRVGQTLTDLSQSGKAADPKIEWKFWLVGVAILVHVVTFWGISYFAQMVVVFYVQLGIAATVGPSFAQETTAGVSGVRNAARPAKRVIPRPRRRSPKGSTT